MRRALQQPQQWGIPMLSPLRALSSRPLVVQKNYFMGEMLQAFNNGVIPVVKNGYTNKGAAELYIYLAPLSYGCYAILHRDQVKVCRGKDSLDNPVVFNNLVYTLTDETYLTSEALRVSYWEFAFVQEVIAWARRHIGC